MATVTGLGLSGSAAHSGEIRVGFRHGLVRYLGITVGGAGAIGAVVAILNLVKDQPQQVFDLLARWGWVWIISLALIFGAWDLAKRFIEYFGKLADSVQESAVAMNRIADKDDRERDRMMTEVSYVGQRLERLSNEQKESRDEQRDHHREVLELLNRNYARGHGDGDGGRSTA